MPVNDPSPLVWQDGQWVAPPKPAYTGVPWLYRFEVGHTADTVEKRLIGEGKGPLHFADGIADYLVGAYSTREARDTPVNWSVGAAILDELHLARRARKWLTAGVLLALGVALFKRKG